MNYLNAHSNFSPMGGLSSPEELLQRAQAYGARALALTDTNGFYGIPRFLEAAKDFDLKPIAGVEVRQTNLFFTALAKNRRGYEGLCLFLTWLKAGTARPQEEEALAKEAARRLIPYASDLIFFSRQKSFLLAMAKKANVYFELTRGFFTHQDALWARRHGIPLLANNKIHYISPEQEEYYQVLRAIENNATLDQVDTSSYHNEHCRMLSPQEFATYFAPYPDALENNKNLPQEIDSDWFFQGNIMPGHNGLPEERCVEILREKCSANISRRYPEADDKTVRKVRERLEAELEVIAHKNFSSYFLNVEEMASLCEYTCGRGSSAASIVNYLLHITHVDPIAENLLFERFMNVDRLDPPDIDVDFPWDQRDDVLDEIFERYAGRVAMVANHNYLRERSAAREVAKVYGIKEDEIAYVMERGNASELGATWERILHTASQIEGVLRHLSVHCGGVIVTPRPIATYVPVEFSAKGLPVIHWEKDQTELAGLVKTDILGNRGLAVIRDVINDVRLNQEEDLCYQRMRPQADKKTQEIFISGNTVGVTHFESPRCQTLLRALKDHKLSTLSIVCSIIRPAASFQATELARRFHGGRFRYLHPKLKEILGSTYGVMIYQEDVMRVSQALAGFTGQEGNELRKALAKKSSKRKKLAFYREKFFVGCARAGVAQGDIEKLWAEIESFAGYSFCKPHSDSYSLVSYKSAYLKARYPAQFMAAVISNGGGFYGHDVEIYLNEARRMGVLILPPDVNFSQYEYSAAQMQIRTGLKQIKGVGRKTLDRILAERNLGAFASLQDFLKRTDIPFHEARALIKARCFGSLRKQGDRKLKNSELMWMLYEHYAKKRGSLPEQKSLPILASGVCEYPKEKMIFWEREQLGAFVTFPAWFLHRDLLKQRSIAPSKQMASFVEQEIILFGQVASIKPVKTKTGQRMAFATFSDDDGMYNTVFFPAQYEEFCDILRLKGSFLLKGKVERDFNDVHLIVSDAQRVAPF